ncbi:hypothetical protein CAI21_09615 [Alkalilimnicola ehrlichii]|uniref:Uncharacterized protein n=1 Tax=Alkalilimnicola ehrlichii TaxID=351052 RepID=A0A3E0WXT9_9GAMM|nr:PD40 domain-containing protein [Alkalilimnicola ehrlichii]RFA29322.1 hypothetical protein CAI21_09615 [Alkalilimnicola ehrlichii]RFA36836.1 hypothetical protein CAL65_09950 [Alkalilimnicola ehrlichii]
MPHSFLRHRRARPIVASLLLAAAGLMVGCERADTAGNGHAPEAGGSPLTLGETPLSGELVFLQSNMRMQDFEFVTLDLATGEKRRYHVGYEVSGPNFSPTSNAIVFHITRDLLTNPRDTIAFLDLETGAVRELDNLPYQAALFPRFSPDGRQLAFYVLTDNEYRSKIYLSDLDGQDLTPIPCPAEALCRHPHWHPSGNRLLYVADETEIHEIDLATEEVKVFRSFVGDNNRTLSRAIYLKEGNKIAVLWRDKGFPRRNGITLIYPEDEKEVVYEGRTRIPSIYEVDIPDTIALAKTNLLARTLDAFLYNYVTGEELQISEPDRLSGGVHGRRKEMH